MTVAFPLNQETPALNVFDGSYLVLFSHFNTIHSKRVLFITFTIGWIHSDKVIRLETSVFKFFFTVANFP